MNKMDKIKSAIAKLDCGNEKGTAFLVGRDIAITATHCIIDALEDDEQADIVLRFENIDGCECITTKATVMQESKGFPVSVLKLDSAINTEVLKLTYFDDKIERGVSLFCYGYPAVKREEGYPVDIEVNDIFNSNSVVDYDIVGLADSKSRITDYSGMSGSPLIFKNRVMGVLLKENLESNGITKQVIDVGIISNKKNLQIYKKCNLEVEKLYYADFSEMEKACNIPKTLHINEWNLSNEKANGNEKTFVDQSAYDELKEIVEEVRKTEIEEIYRLKLEGKQEEAWSSLLALIVKVRGEKDVDRNLLAKLYYIRALWYLEDKNDGQNAQKYLKKVKDNWPEYDCRTFVARKYHLEGNVLEEKKVLLPIDNKSVLNVYVQLCVLKGEVDEAIDIYEKHKELADYVTHYLMALVYILDHDYDIAESFIDKALFYGKRAPMYILVKGIIRYWKAVPMNISNIGGISPSMHNMEVVLSDIQKQEFEEATKWFEKAYKMAEEVENKELMIQSLNVWLNALSISKIYGEKAMELAYKVLELVPYQWQAIAFLFMKGENLTGYKSEEIKAFIKSVNSPIDPILSCVYIELSQHNKKNAFSLLKQYQYEFKRTNLIEFWFELVIKTCDLEYLEQIPKEIEISNLDEISKMRLIGIYMEVKGEKEKLLPYLAEIYRKTKQEIDLINVINLNEKYQLWMEVERYSLEWKKEFNNGLANVHYVRALAMQNKHKECLKYITEIKQIGCVECLEDEIEFYEAQCLKVLGELDKAIDIVQELWDKTSNQNVLILLSECLFLNGDLSESISMLKQGIKKGKRSVSMYQTLAEYQKLISKKDAVKTVKKAMIIADNDPTILMWAMQFLYSIGESDSANEIFVRLQAKDEINIFQKMSFKEIRKLMEKRQKEQEELYQKYKNAEISYHVYWDRMNTSSYTASSLKIWENNRNGYIVPDEAYCGKHNITSEQLDNIYMKDVVIDFSTLLRVYNLELWEEMKKSWNCIYVSPNINNVLTTEIKRCMPNQPDVLKKEKEQMEEWKKKGINYINIPKLEEIAPKVCDEIEYADWVPYQLSKSNDLVWIEDGFTTDLMGKSDSISTEMRQSAVSVYELLIALEKRGDISSEFLSQYKGSCQKVRTDIIDRLVVINGKIPILVDGNFLREIYNMDGISLISQKCMIYTLDNVFVSIEQNLNNLKYMDEASEILQNLQDEIYKAKECGKIKFCEHYQDEEIEGDIYTQALMDVFHCALNHQMTLICDDRMVNSYNTIGEMPILAAINVIEMMYIKRVISEQKYVKCIYQLLCEGYCFFVPPYEYMRLVVFQMEDSENAIKNLPDELRQVRTYLKQICPLECKMLNNDVVNNQIPESVAYMCFLQKAFMDLLTVVWESNRSLKWKQTISDWLVINYSEFGYDFYFYEVVNEQKYHFKALQIASFILAGVKNNFNKKFQKEYYEWLFEWLEMYFANEKGIEEKTFDALATFLVDASEKWESNQLYEIGLGTVLKLALENMPEYYAEKICSYSKIMQLLEKVESNITVLDRENIVDNVTFFGWLESAMRYGTNQSIKVNKNEVDYEVTWIADKIVYQAFSIKWIDNTEKRHEVYYKVEMAMLRSEDAILSAKGFYSLSKYLIPSNVKRYEIDFNNKDKKQKVIEEIYYEVKSSHKYVDYVVDEFLENSKVRIYGIDEFLPNSPMYFEKSRIDYPEEYYINKVEWCKSIFNKTHNPEILLEIIEVLSNNKCPEVQEAFIRLTDRSNKEWYNLYLALVRFFVEQMIKRKEYKDISLDIKTKWAHYFTGIILQKCEEKNIEELQELFDDILVEQAEYGYSIANIREFSYARLITKPLCNILNQCEECIISKELVQNWLNVIENDIKNDLQTFDEAFALDSDISDGNSHKCSGNLLNAINNLKVKYSITEQRTDIRTMTRGYIHELTEKKEAITTNEYAFLWILLKDSFPKEWEEEVQHVINRFPDSDVDMEDTRKVLIICAILDQLTQEFSQKYILVIKEWLIGRFINGNIEKLGDYLLIMERVSQIENEDNPIIAYVNMWEEIVDKEEPIICSDDLIEYLCRLTMVLPMDSSKRLRKVIDKLSK